MNNYYIYYSIIGHLILLIFSIIVFALRFSSVEETHTASEQFCQFSSSTLNKYLIPVSAPVIGLFALYVSVSIYVSNQINELSAGVKLLTKIKSYKNFSAELKQDLGKHVVLSMYDVLAKVTGNSNLISDHELKSN